MAKSGLAVLERIALSTDGRVDLGYLDITGQDMPNLIEDLKKQQRTQAITSLQLGGNKIDDAGFRLLLNAVRDGAFPELITIIATGNDSGNGGHSQITCGEVQDAIDVNRTNTLRKRKEQEHAVTEATGVFTAAQTSPGDRWTDRNSPIDVTAAIPPNDRMR